VDPLGCQQDAGVKANLLSGARSHRRRELEPHGFILNGDLYKPDRAEW
jgi:hypothetical protein